MSHDTDISARKIHASRVEEECPWRAHQYAAGAWLPPARRPFLRGTAVHEGRHYALKHYMEAGDLPPVAECQGAAVMAAEARNDEDNARGVGLPPEEVTAALDEALPIVAADRALLLPSVAPQVEAVEEPLEADLGGGWALVGTLDARGRDPHTGTGVISDLKTSGKSPGAAALAHAALSTQLSAYSLLHSVHHDGHPLIALHYVWTMARGPKADTIERDGLIVGPLEGGRVGVARIIPTQRSREDHDALLRLIRVRIDQEESGWHAPVHGGFMSPCQRCWHWGHEDPSQRCGFRPGARPAALAQEEE